MLTGVIASLVSADINRAQELANSIAKLNDKGHLLMYYRRLSEEKLLSIIVPAEYPSTVINATISMSLADIGVVVTGYEMDWRDGELLTLVDASSSQLGLTAADSREGVERLVKSSGLRLSTINASELATSLLTYGEKISSRNEGYVFIDRAFLVKGVGPVVLGYTKTNVYVHDKLYAVPINKQIEIKSIEVLDEEMDSVGPGVRIGFAIKGAEVDELKDVYALVPEPSKIVNKLTLKVKAYPWTEVPTSGTLHVVGGGAAVVASIDRYDNNSMELSLSRPLPLLDKYLLVNVNAKQKRSRVLGYLFSG